MCSVSWCWLTLVGVRIYFHSNAAEIHEKHVDMYTTHFPPERLKRKKEISLIPICDEMYRVDVWSSSVGVDCWTKYLHIIHWS